MSRAKRTVPAPIGDQSTGNQLVQQHFRQYASELDEKHDRYERIFKYSRDITIESKRIIFLLHNIDGRMDNKSKILQEAWDRLNHLTETNFKSIASELYGLDPYQYAKAYSPGLQEFVEALTYYQYLTTGRIEGYDVVQKMLTYYGPLSTIQTRSGGRNRNPEISNDKKPEIEADVGMDVISNDFPYTFLVQPMEFMLGLADLSGELNRYCVTSLGLGDIDNCFVACNFLKLLYTFYMGMYNIRNKDMTSKIYTLRQSVTKAENVCYNIKVRGREAAKWGTEEQCKEKETDEGFF